MKNTIEKQADVKNGVSRMIFAVISILLEVAVILTITNYYVRIAIEQRKINQWHSYCKELI